MEQIHGWLIYRKVDAHKNMPFIDWFIKECEKQSIALQLIYRENLHIGVVQNSLTCLVENRQTPLPDFVVIRTVEPILNQQFEHLEVPTFNSATVSSVCNNKAKTHQFFALHNIPMVDSLFMEKEQLEHGSLPFSYPFIVKTVNGRGGKQVHWINSKEDIPYITSSLNNDSILVQRPAEINGKDLRVFVVGNRIIGAILRENDTNFKANYTLGGKASWYELNEMEITLIKKIIALFDFGMVGIDFLFDEKGQLLLNEIEDVVGSRTLSLNSSINILEYYVLYIKEALLKKQAD